MPEPGLWFQCDWGKGRAIGGRETNLWCAWLAWSRYRVIIPTWDKTLATVVACRHPETDRPNTLLESGAPAAEMFCGHYVDPSGLSCGQGGVP